MTDNTQQVLFDISAAGVATITLNRPEVHNAFNDECISRLIAAIDTCHNHEEVRVVVLRSTGKNFSAGADLAWMKSMAQLNYEENKQDAAALAQLMEKLYRLDKPVVTRAQGKSFGGALGLLACSDIVIADDSASFCLSEVKIGLVPAVISPYVVKAIGQRNASRYFLTAEAFNAQQALAFGLIHEACPSDELDSKLDTIINTLVNNGPCAVREAKALVHYVGDNGIDPVTINHTTELIAKIRVSEEGQEGLGAFLEKRKPTWIQS
ncbi:MAG: enoyl-CoA hydratase/isomerase family protein [Pseudomonadales bacterium]|nr:enoyl-CoA hydratase/isomerase family protein [Pseudomonadales bacterium]